MNLQSELPEALWQATRSSFTSGNFTGAINDAFYFLTEIIHNKADSVDDGVALIGQAFGKENPRVKLNQLETISEKDFQKGILHILMGMYEAIRNPRAHEKIEDSQIDAESIIIFIGFLVRKIDVAKAKFSIEEYTNRVFDKNFVSNLRYSKMLVDEIPSRLPFEVFIKVYKQKNRWNPHLINYFFHEILIRLEDRKKEICEMISSDLRVATDDEIRLLLPAIAASIWHELDEIARMRTEHTLICSILGGRYDGINKKVTSGHLGTWAVRIFSDWGMKDELRSALYQKFKSEDVFEHAYVFQFLFSRLDKVWPDNPPAVFFYPWINKIKSGNKLFYESLTEYCAPWSKELYSAELCSALDKYQEHVPSNNFNLDDEIPF